MNDCSIFFSISSSRTLLRLPEKWARNSVSCYITVITDCESVSIFHRFSNLSSMMSVPNFRQVVLLRKHDFLLTFFSQNVKCMMAAFSHIVPEHLCCIHTVCIFTMVHNAMGWELLTFVAFVAWEGNGKIVKIKLIWSSTWANMARAVRIAWPAVVLPWLYSC